MEDLLRFPIENGTSEQYQGFSVRAWKGIPYCGAPVDEIQRLNLYAPAGYFTGETVNGYSLKTAPIFLPNWVGGYMPGIPAEPKIEENGDPNEVLAALRQGYVVACAGIRGRTTADNHGKAPALIVDMKAAVRYLRHNRDVIPGDTEKMITSGTSAGGALSALAGTSGNAAAYESYLGAIGAAQERDDIFAANCYCPIINLEHADAAYEWQFSRERYFRNWHGEGQLTDAQMDLAKLLKAQFPEYLNGLSLHDAQGNALSLDVDGSGTFQEYIKQAVIRSAQAELDTPRNYKRTVPGSEVANQSFLTIRDGKVEDLDWDGFIHAITRMKQPPAFDALTLSSPENEVFGGSDGAPRHFTPFSQARTGGPIADGETVTLLNPMEQLHSSGCAKHWRIRHGAYDRDTSLAISAMFALALNMRGCWVDYHLPWGIPHSGNYDLPELFAWIDGLCKGCHAQR